MASKNISSEPLRLRPNSTQQAQLMDPKVFVWNDTNQAFHFSRLGKQCIAKIESTRKTCVVLLQNYLEL